MPWQIVTLVLGLGLFISAVWLAYIIRKYNYVKLNTQKELAKANKEIVDLLKELNEKYDAIIEELQQ